jgi:hypothetical protein
MPPPDLVADYLDALSHELAFDPSLSTRVRHEVEDHLCEAIAADPADSPSDAARRAINRFGAPHEIAAQYKTASLYIRMRKTGALVVCVVAGAFLAMESRVVWYALTQWGISPRIRAVGEIVVPIDRYAFMFAIALGLLGWLYVVSRPIPINYRQASRDQLRRGQLLTAAAACSVAVAVTCEVLLTSLRLAETQWSVNWLFPLVSIAAEIGLVVAIAIYIRNTIRRAAVCPIQQ